jgi:hypothetical protein
MKRRLRVLIVFAGTIGMVMALNVGAALAVHVGPSPAFGTTVQDAPSPVPVGSHLLGDVPGAPGFENGFAPRPGSGAGLAIANNPNCPAHYAIPTP